MKAILMSIQPKWCELIVSGKKTIEVRKTAPKDTPFKAYIYETKGKKKYWSQPMPIPYYDGKGKVIGEFICDKVDTYEANDRGWYIYPQDEVYMWTDEIAGYGKGKPLYGWHISDLKIYDEPKELSEFASCKHCHNGECFMTYKNDCVYREPDLNQDGSVNIFICSKRITRPPQSWQYVEEL